jgi:hypothetical protein
MATARAVFLSIIEHPSRFHKFFVSPASRPKNMRKKMPPSGKGNQINKQTNASVSCFVAYVIR